MTGYVSITLLAVVAGFTLTGAAICLRLRLNPPKRPVSQQTPQKWCNCEHHNTASAYGWTYCQNCQRGLNPNKWT